VTLSSRVTPAWCRTEPQVVVAFRFVADQKAKRMPNPSRSHRSDDAMAAELCVLLLLSGKHEGRFAMSANALMAASKLPRDLFRATQAWAVQCDWLRTRFQYVELKAAGIHVAKKVLDLPR
jgi:hypothetical protein